MDGLSALSESLASVIEKIGAGVVGVEGRGSRGTGVAWSSDGLVVTADHVVRHEDGVRVRLADGATVDADLVGRDPTTDVALLRARGAALTVPLWADPASLRVGNLVLALGRPGQSLRATIGIVSVLGEAWQTPAGGRLMGDTLLAVAGQAVRYPEELFGLLGGERIGSSVPIQIIRAGKTQELTITVGERLRRSA